MTTQEKEAAIRKRLEEIYPQLKINCKKVCGSGYDLWGSNLLPHIISEFLSINLDKQYRIMVQDDAGEFYITRSMAMSLKSSTSSFWRIYRRDSNSFRELLPDYRYPKHVDDYEEEDITEVKECLRYHVDNTLDFYDKYLVQEHYYNGTNLSTISENTGIQPYRVTADIKKALKKLKKLCGKSL